MICCHHTGFGGTQGQKEVQDQKGEGEGHHCGGASICSLDHGWWGTRDEEAQRFKGLGGGGNTTCSMQIQEKEDEEG